MSTLLRFKSPVIFLASEFVVIVLGVLTALAVDEWRNSREQAEIREQLLTALIPDLDDDLGDYEQVVRSSRTRLDACGKLLNADVVSLDGNEAAAVQLGDAFFHCSRYARLETSETAISEMTANGSGRTIEDTELRIRIMRYYALARDRADINMLFQSTTLAHVGELANQGFALLDRQGIDAPLVLSNPVLRARIKGIMATLPYAIEVTEDLIQENRALLAELAAVREDSD